MRANKAAITRFGSPITGVALLKKETISFNLNAGSYPDGYKFTGVVDIPGAVAYVSDAHYRLSGGQNERARPWSWAPRKFYLVNEAAMPSPRFYLYKENQREKVVIDCFLYYCQPITRNYVISIDVYVFVSHFL